MAATSEGEYPRDLTSEEHALIEFLVSLEFKGAEELRVQLGSTTVSGRCTCSDQNCATVELVVTKDVPPAPVNTPYPVDALGREHQVSLEVTDGYMSELEIIEFEHSTRRVPRSDELEQISIDGEPYRQAR